MRFYLRILIALLGVSCLRAVADSPATVTPGHFADIWYDWPTVLFDSNFTLKIETDPGIGTAYYWSHYFIFANSKGEGTGSRSGYMGLQTAENRKIAIFSIWNALAAEGEACETFGGEGIGYHCLVDFNFSNGGSYTLFVRSLAGDSTGDWWEGSVKDLSTGQERIIGRIKSPPGSGGIKTSSFFDEYYSTIAGCIALAEAKVRFFGLQGNQGSVIPTLNGFNNQDSKCKSDALIKMDGLNVDIETSGTFSKSN
jgi:hypothetical protein